MAGTHQGSSLLRVTSPVLLASEEALRQLSETLPGDTFASDPENPDVDMFFPGFYYAV